MSKYSGENDVVVMILLKPKIGADISINKPDTQNKVVNVNATSYPDASKEFVDISIRTVCVMDTPFDSPVEPDEHIMAAMWVSASTITGL